MDDAARFESVRAALRQPDRGLYFAPIRHHSPACAWAVRELIRDVRPQRVLIEAPADLVEHIDVVLDGETRPPVAIAAMVERDSETRLASYFPFCAHSPEYVALVEGRGIGAELEFIDLPAAHKAMLREPDPSERPVVVDDEAYFDSGDYIDALCRELGCRNGFELWDHLFESRLGGDDWQGLLADIGAYCAGLRLATPADRIQQCGDLDREAHMAAAMHAALEADGPVVVIAGGFHVPALIDAKPGQDASPGKTSQVAGSYLIRYGFEALDALNGYGAGLPQPGYYDYLWTRANESEGEPPWRETALDLVSAFTARLRDEGHPVSVPAQVEILRAAEALAAMRGRRGAGRHDLIDAVRTALVKGEVGAREIWTERLLEFLRGTTIGDVPASAGSPPIVEDARRRARSLRINVSDGARRRRSLDIRRKPAHLEASRFFHAMALLESQFAEREGGPDFLNGINTGRLFEDWSYAWSPLTEGRLIELSIHGDSVPDACLHLLEFRRSALQEEGRSRDIGAIAGLFVEGVIAGLGRKLVPFLDSLAADIQASTEFEVVALTLRRLHHIALATGPLRIPAELDLDGVRQSAFRRLVYLCDDLPDTPAELVQGCMEALRLVLELLREPGADVFDHSLFDEAIDRVADADPPPSLLGAVLAICVQAGRRPAGEICSAISGSFAGTVDEQEDRIGVLRGLLFTAPDLLWRNEEILVSVDAMLTGMSEDEFLELLPHLRLAFTALNPRESDKLAAMLAAMHGGRLTEFAGSSHALSEAELNRGLRIEKSFRETLDRDGLAEWLGGDS